MTNEEIQSIVARAEDEYEMLKDRVHDLYDENENLKSILKDINYYIKQRVEENIPDKVRMELTNIELISKGIIKVVKEENIGSDKE